MKPSFWKGVLVFGLLLGGACLGQARAGNGIITVPVILADYYGWSYYEPFEDHANVYAWSIAGVDAIGWSVYLVSGDEAGMKLVNMAGVAKTVYPMAALLWASDTPMQDRAWIGLGAHMVTLVTLELLGRPALSINTSLGPRHDGTGMTMAFRF